MHTGDVFQVIQFSTIVVSLHAGFVGSLATVTKETALKDDGDNALMEFLK